MKLIQTYFHPKPVTYTGVELSPHYLLSQFNQEGSVLAAFHGPCFVKTDDLVDWEDRLNHDHIKAASMVHFLGEFFGITLKEGVWIQRVLAGLIQAWLTKQGVVASRSGDDIFIHLSAEEDRKLTVSIVTASPVSVLLHLGVNIDATGAPVSAIGLKDIGIDSQDFTREILESFQEEYESVARACVKVRPVL